MAAPASNTKTRTATTCRTYFACLVFWAILGACGAIGHQAAAKAADAKGGYFELCPKGHRTGALALETTARQVLPRRSFGSPASACERGAGVIVWRGDGSSFCCPAAAGWCGGCAEANDKEDACGKCLGGWVLERGYCTACMDFPGWHDAKGRNCYAAGCSKDRFQGSSSAMACCSCGGGLRQATRFGYYTESRLRHKEPCRQPKESDPLSSPTPPTFRVTPPGNMEIRPGPEVGTRQDFSFSGGFRNRRGRLKMLT